MKWLTLVNMFKAAKAAGTLKVYLWIAAGIVTAMASGIAWAYFKGVSHEKARWEKAAADHQVELAKHEAKIIGEFHDNLNALHEYYKLNPVTATVRVRVPATCPEGGSTETVAVDPKDIVLTVGGYKPSDGKAVAR